MISDDEVATVSSIVDDKMVAAVAVAVPPALKLKTEPRRYFTMEPPKPDVDVADRMPTIMVAAGYLMVLLVGVWFVWVAEPMSDVMRLSHVESTRV